MVSVPEKESRWPAPLITASSIPLIPRNEKSCPCQGIKLRSSPTVSFEYRVKVFRYSNAVVADVDGFHNTALSTVSNILVSQKKSGSVFFIVKMGTLIGTRQPSGNAFISN